MADDVAITAGAGTSIATDDIGGRHFQRVKATFGADGTATDVSATNPLPVSTPGLEYETVAASQTDQVIGATGATGDYLSHLVITPAAAAAGAVSIKDGSGSVIPIFAGGGTLALPTLAPLTVFLGLKSTGGAWKVTTGANVSVIAVGDFT